MFLNAHASSGKMNVGDNGHCFLLVERFAEYFSVTEDLKTTKFCRVYFCELC